MRKAGYGSLPRSTIRFDWFVFGSATLPIIKKSRESLLGRVKDSPLIPFSFRKFLLSRFRDRQSHIHDL